MTKKIKVTDEEVLDGFLTQLEYGSCQGEILHLLTEAGDRVKDLPVCAVNSTEEKLKIVQLLHSISCKLNILEGLAHNY